MKQSSRLRDGVLAVLFCGAFLLLADRLIPFDFAINDDTTMISILNGSYTGTPSGYAVFISYPLGWFISRLYATGIAVCWYKWTLMGCALLALASVLYRLYQRFPGQKLLSTAAVLGGCSFLWLPQIMHASYNYGAALAMACTILSYGIQRPEDDTKPGYLLNLLLQFFLSYQLRDYFAYIIIPFLGVLWLQKHWGALISNRACWLVPVSGLLCLGLAMGVERIAYSGDWAAFHAYNDQRSYLQDYDKFPDYQENQAFITSLGLTREEYQTLCRYTYLMIDDMEPEIITALYHYVTSQETTSSEGVIGRTLSRTVSTYFYTTLTPLRLGSYLAPAVLLLAGLAVCRKQGCLSLLPVLLLLGGCAGIWLLLCYMGRTPERVVLSLRLLTIAAPIAGCFTLLGRHPLAWNPLQGRRAVSLVLSGAMLLLCLCGGMRALDRQSGRKNPQKDYLLYAQQHPEAIFIRDIKSTVSGEPGRLLEFPRAPVNMLSTGGWVVFSPLYQQKLETLGLSRVNRSLLLEDNVYLLVNLERFNLQKLLGLPRSTPIDYQVTQQFQRDLSMVKINSIG